MENFRKKKIKSIYQNTLAGILFQMKLFTVIMKLKMKMVLIFLLSLDLKLNGLKKNRIFLNYQNGKNHY